jgi:hypothetical protein
MDQVTSLGSPGTRSHIGSALTTQGYRYPGSPPFSDSDLDRLVFRGRESEADEVFHSILSFDLFVLYGSSGNGKTSLLRAGVFQHLRDRNYWPVVIRLNDPGETPIGLIDDAIRIAADTSDEIDLMHHPSSEGYAAETLWDLLGTLEIWKGNKLQQPVLVFDQFEELFTLAWSDEARRDLIAGLGEVIRRHRVMNAETQHFSGVRLPPPDVKVVLVLREDSLGELEALATDIPQIMRNRYRLLGLDELQAARAIREPALFDDPRLRSHRFAYTEEAANLLLEFLHARDERGEQVRTRRVDPSQLQIIAQHVERIIVAGKEGIDDPTARIEIAVEDLGGLAGLNEILEDFYRREIGDFAPAIKAKVKDLCEYGLISRSGRRLSLEEGEIQAGYGVSKNTLQELIDRRLLRAEPRVGSVYYELAHDSLVAPILASRETQEARASRFDKWAFGFGIANVPLGFVGGPSLALSLLALRSTPTARRGQWKSKLALGSGLLWMSVYSLAFLYPESWEAEGLGFALIIFALAILQPALGAILGLSWRVVVDPSSAWMRVATMVITTLALAAGLSGMVRADFTVADTSVRLNEAALRGSTLTLGVCLSVELSGDIVDVDCDRPHQYEVYAEHQFEGDTYPGDNVVAEELGGVCFEEFEPFVGHEYASSIYDFSTFGLSQEDWGRGERTGYCLLHLFGVPTKDSSARGSGR